MYPPGVLSCLGTSFEVVGVQIGLDGKTPPVLCCGVRGVKGGEPERAPPPGRRIDGKREGMNFLWRRRRGGVMPWLLAVVPIKELAGEISGVGLLPPPHLPLLRPSRERRLRWGGDDSPLRFRLRRQRNRAQMSMRRAMVAQTAMAILAGLERPFSAAVAEAAGAEVEVDVFDAAGCVADEVDDVEVVVNNVDVVREDIDETVNVLAGNDGTGKLVSSPFIGGSFVGSDEVDIVSAVNVNISAVVGVVVGRRGTASVCWLSGAMKVFASGGREKSDSCKTEVVPCTVLTEPNPTPTAVADAAVGSNAEDSHVTDDVSCSLENELSVHEPAPSPSVLHLKSSCGGPGSIIGLNPLLQNIVSNLQVGLIKKEEASLVTGGDDRINIRCVPHLSLLVRDKKSDHLASALLLLTILPQSPALVYRYPAKRRVAPVKGPKPVFSNLDTFARRVEIAAHFRPSRRRFAPSRAYRLQKLRLAVGYAFAPVLVPCPLLDLRLVDMTLAAAVLFLVVLLVDPFHRDPYS